MLSFRHASDMLNKQHMIPKLSTGSGDLDSLLGGGIEPSQFYLFYGDEDSGVDLLIHQLLVNSLLPEEKFGFGGKCVYANCGSYHVDRTMMDTRLLCDLVKAAGLDPLVALDNIYTICSFSEQQEEHVFKEIQKLVERDKEIKLVVVHNLARLFTMKTHTPNKDAGKRILILQNVVFNLWQICAINNIGFVASCRPNSNCASYEVPRPEGGKYLCHKATVITYFRKRKKNYVWAYLIKHPSRKPRKIGLEHRIGDDILGRITVPFRTLLQKEMDTLKRTYREALMDTGRRDAFDSLIRTWSSEQGAMSYARIPTALDVMLLTAAIDNRKLIEELSDQLGVITSKLSFIENKLQKTFD